MALQNDIGYYLKITEVDLQKATYSIYKNEYTRFNFYPEFDKTIDGEFQLPQDFMSNFNVIPDKNLEENIITAAYLSMKRDQLYSYWIDV